MCGRQYVRNDDAALCEPLTADLAQTWPAASANDAERGIRAEADDGDAPVQRSLL